MALVEISRYVSVVHPMLFIHKFSSSVKTLLELFSIIPLLAAGSKQLIGQNWSSQSTMVKLPAEVHAFAGVRWHCGVDATFVN